MTTAIIIILMIDVLRSISPRLDSLFFSPPPTHHPTLSVCLSVCVRPWSLFFHVIITIMVNMRANTAVLAQHTIQKQPVQRNDLSLSKIRFEGRDKQAKTEH